MNKSHIKRDIASCVESIDIAFEELENIIEDINDTELYETTLHWIDKAQSIIENGVDQTLTQLDNID
jgi:hypothetical protein